MRKLLLLLFTIFSIFCTTTFAIDVPTPYEKSWIHDYANVIDESTESSINALGDELDLNGYGQMVFVVVEFLDGYDVEDYAYALFNNWGIGHSDDNDGVLVLISVGDREYHFLQGKGLEKILSSSDLGEIADEELIPSLANDNYNQGLLNTAKEISDRLTNYYAYNNAGNPGESDVTNSTSSSFSFILTSFLFELITFLIIIAIMFAFLNLIGGARRRRYYTPYYHRPYGHRPNPMMHHRPSPTRHFSNPSPRPSRPSTSRPSRPSSSRSSSRSFGGGASRGGGRGGKF